MSASPIEIIPTEINLNVSSLHLGNQAAKFIRNLDLTQYNAEKGDNLMVFKPLPSVDLYDPTFKLPAGRNLAVGKKISHDTNEVYVFVWNSEDNHSIYRIKNGKCQFVYIGKELKFVLNPVYFISETSCAVITYCMGKDNKTMLLWTHGINTQRMLCVEDSIATNFFDATKFPRLITTKKEELISLGLAAPTDCIGIKEWPITEDSESLINKLKFNTWQFRLSYIDVYGRPSEHGVISDIYYQSDCAGLRANCLELSFDAGGPLVEKWRIEYRRSCTTEWAIHETINKYDNCDKPWYEREISKAITYNRVTNKITYKFCADKECQPVPDVETQRVENPLPLVSQTVFNIAGGIGLGGNDYGFKPFSCEIMDNVKVEIENPTLTNAETLPTRTIVVWAMIFGRNNGPRCQPVWEKEGRVVFGGTKYHDIEGAVGSAYRQIFPEKQDGFIGYLSGTGYTAISTQYKLTGIDQHLIEVALLTGETISSGAWTEVGVLNEGEAQDLNSFFLQKFEFKNVSPANYVFRIAGHESSLNGDYKSTSTYYHRHVLVEGIVPKFHKSGEYAREMRINVCEKDFDSMKDMKRVVEIADLTHVRDFPTDRPARSSAGYLYEAQSSSGAGVSPISGVPIHFRYETGTPLFGLAGLFGSQIDPDSLYSARTDYNGFWFSTTKVGDHVVRMHPFRKCHGEQFEPVEWSRSNSPGLKMARTVLTQKWAEYEKEECNRVHVKGKVIDCATNRGIQGILVQLTDGHTAITDKEGSYDLITYDFTPLTPQEGSINGYSTSIPRREVYFISGGRCRAVGCNGEVCLPVLTYNIPSCVSCNSRIVNLTNISLSVFNKKISGPQLGGRYSFGIKGADWMDRKTFIQTTEKLYLDIPNANELGGFAYPQVRWSLAGVTFPLWVKKIYFNWTKNLKYSDFLTWVVDRYELIDNTGNENKLSPTQIKIYYSSLNEYNKQNNFSTNSTWQFIDEKDSLKVTDTVQFIANGDGKLFPKAITELVRFDKDGKYFLIDYNVDLIDLKEGALVKLMRDKECEGRDLYYEICDPIDVVDGKPVVTSGVLSIRDSYFVTRQIPTPITTTKKYKKAVPGTAGGATEYEEIEESETINALRSYGWLFEHHSPSDFWGTGCDNRGRVGVKNEYENEICKKSEIALSGVLGTNGLINYLHYFDDKKKKPFDEHQWGGIVGIIPQLKTLLVICENDHFLVPFDDRAVRVEGDKVVANTGERQFGDPQRKAGDNYGCKKKDRNTISYDNGIAAFFDSSCNYLIYHNFQSATMVAKDKIESFMLDKTKFVQESSTRYFHFHFNPKDEQGYLTDFDYDKPEYINNALSPQVKRNETLCFESSALRKFVSFTPELYASLPGEESDKQFFSFKEGLPYSHYRSNPTAFNRFYGFQCQHSMRLAIGDPMKVLEYMAMEVYVDNVLMWSPEVTTEHKQISKIPRNWFKRGNKLWAAPFLCDLKSFLDANKGKEVTENILFGGDTLRGRYVEVLLVGDPANLGKYFELTGVTIFVNGIEKTGT